jgi:hypothetical protein
MNPELRHGASTSEFIEKLRNQALGGAPAGAAKSAAPAAATASAPASDDDKRKQTINLFLELRGKDLGAQLTDVEARRKQIEDEAKALRTQAVEEIVDYLKVVHAAGADLSLAQQCLKAHRDLLAQLGINENEILRQVRR